MAKQSFAEKLAERSFRSARIQNDWNMHMQAFGPILELAFTESYQAKVHLTAALSALSNHRFKATLNKLKTLQSYCKTDADYAAWEFCVGLCCEMQGDTDGMVQHFTKAGAYGHRFYLVELKLAKTLHNAGEFERAIVCYHRALEMLDGETMDEKQSVVIRASVYTNLASCLTMLYRYAEAEQMLAISKEIASEQSGRAVTEAILYAAMGQREKVSDCLNELEQRMPELVEAVTKTVEDILSGNHEHFKNR